MNKCERLLRYGSSLTQLFVQIRFNGIDNDIVWVCVGINTGICVNNCIRFEVGHLINPIDIARLFEMSIVV